MRVNKNYVLGLLTVMLCFNYMDRFALGIVLPDIKNDLQLSDSQLGFLSGMAFALFYSFLGIPIARWADRGNRTTIVALSAAVWSVAVTLCGVAATFLQLLLIRVAVGIGEAGCVPPSLSLLADYFRRDERPRAVAVYMQGISASFIVGFFAAGWLNELLGWRLMFAVIGAPGLLLALLARTTVKDPRTMRQTATTHAAATGEGESFRIVLAAIWRIGTFRHVLYSLAVNWFLTYGTLQWTPTFFVRSFGLRTGPLGSWLAVIYGVSSLVGTYLGGEWATRHANRNERLQLQGMALITAVSGVLIAFMFVPALAPGYFLALLWLGLSMLTAATVNGPQFAVIQALIPARRQALAIAIVYLCGNLVGLGLGPWAVGALSDWLRPWVADESLRYSMLLLCPGFIWSAWHLWLASKTVNADMATVADDSQYARSNEQPYLNS